MAYALGQKDELKGTGVFSGIQLKREPKDDKDNDDDKSKKATPAETPEKEVTKSK